MAKRKLTAKQQRELQKLRKEAEGFFEQGKFQELIVLLNDDVLEKYQDAVLYAWVSLSHTNVDAQGELAYQFAQQALNIDKKNSLCFIARGHASIHKDEFEKAIEDYSAALRLKPNHDYIINYRGLAYFLIADIDKALLDFGNAINISPQNPQYYRNRGMALCAKEEFHRAIESYNVAIELDDTIGFFYLERGNAWFSLREYDRAFEDYDKAVNLIPNDAEALFARGKMWAMKKEYDRAISDYTAAIETEPENKILYSFRGIAYSNKKDYNNALADYNKAIALGDISDVIYNNRGLALQKNSKVEESILDFNKSIEINPLNASVFRNRGLSWYQKGKYENAISDFDKAISIMPNLAKAYNSRGNAKRKMRDLIGAISDYSQAILLDPEHVFAYVNRGAVFATLGDIKQALSDFNKALSIDENNISSLLQRGVFFDQIGEFNNAIADFTSVVQLVPGFAFAYYLRALSRKKGSNDLAGAIDDLTTCISFSTNENDSLIKLANSELNEIRENLRDPQLAEIGDLIRSIKEILIFRDDHIVHYTSFSTAQKLVLNQVDKFRIYEGTFMNDTSEGTELFKFLEYKSSENHSDGLLAEQFVSKPFIGSFVAFAKHDDLNLWRFYGKEGREEAKGCAICVSKNDFVEILKQITSGTFPNMEEEIDSVKSLNIKDDIDFYRIAYWNRVTEGLYFYVPGLEPKDEKDLIEKMQQLKDAVNGYTGNNQLALERYLNSIAYLFKSDAYKNENEIRLVIKGIEFEKNEDSQTTPPKVFIELVNIRKLVKQITLGPKVDKAEEWAAVFHYSFAKEASIEMPKIFISRLPYK